MVGSDYTVYAQEETDEEVSWELRTGEILRELPDHKYIGKIQLYLELDPGARAEVALRRDGGAWEKVQELSGGDQRRCTLPIYPQAVRPDGDSPDGGGPCAAGELEQIRGIWE